MVNDGQAEHSGNINKTDADLATHEVAGSSFFTLTHTPAGIRIESVARFGLVTPWYWPT
ncbi:uncharacterized protein METZ01_LOCUS507649 [marine metagenome]|uniref:Uncharacterized protein n=1 Tax=marine metagenome TaxID=408172 RepID=A0A383EEM9_9ZZZZ